MTTTTPTRPYPRFELLPDGRPILMTHAMSGTSLGIVMTDETAMRLHQELSGVLRNKAPGITDELATMTDLLELFCRSYCRTDYEGCREHPMTNSLGDETKANALRVLASCGRFRITDEYGRGSVYGYWPEHDKEQQ